MKVKEAVKFLSEKVDPEAELKVWDGVSMKSVEDIFDNEISTVKIDREKIDKDFEKTLNLLGDKITL